MNKTAKAAGEQAQGQVRLQRVLAEAGVAARRVCEELIEAGRVTVNGEVVRKLPVFVDPDRDSIHVDGRPLPRAERKLYLMVHKPERVLVTNADEPEFDRTTIMQLVDHPSAGRLYPVGRLDFDTAGLVLLTNDGAMANRLTHPRYGVAKTYEVMVRGRVDQQAVSGIPTKLRAMARRESQAQGPGFRVKGSTGEFEVIGSKGGNTLLRVTLREARNRELREVFTLLGMPIKKLTRVGIGPLQLKGLALGQWRELAREEVHSLKKAAERSAPRRNPKKPGGHASAAPIRARRERRSGSH